MKFSLALLFVCLVALNYSCKKEKTFENDEIYGAWKLTEIYEGYANGGNFMWNKVSDENSHTLVFLENGDYREIKNGPGIQQECTGTFQIVSDTLVVNSSCQTVTMKMRISELNKTTLIINHQGREGTIRNKYVAVK